ncbi:hypothetical protein D3C75_1133490 [compost metagenome]
MIEYRNEKRYLSNQWHIYTPRWLGECGNKPEEEEVCSEIQRLLLYIAEELKGGWGNQS